MIAFIVLALSFVVGALALILPPLLRSRPSAPTPETDQAATALKVLREQLAELEAERTAGRVADADYTRQKEELEARALAEGQAEAAPLQAKPARSWAILAGIAVPVMAVGFYLALGNPHALDPLKVSGGAGVTQAQIESMVQGLAKKLENEPDNVEGWTMLARSYRALQRFGDAAKAYEHLAAKQPDNAQVFADWADALGAAQGHKLDGKPAELVARAIQLDPNNGKALALAGTIAFEKGDFPAAARDWEKLLAQIPPGDEVADSIRRGVNEARSRAGMPPLADAGGAMGGMPAGGTGAESGQNGGGQLALKGELRLDPKFAAEATPDETVFVFVRGGPGGPPLAARRYTVSQLPVQFDFTNAQMMVPGRPVPAQVSIGARVSRSGNPMPAPGDLEGAVGPVAPDASGLSVVIDTKRP